jgi:hypothetical protein
MKFGAGLVSSTALLRTGIVGANKQQDVSESKEEQRKLLAGAAASNITPALGVSLDGTILQHGPIKHIHDELFARALVLDNGSARMAIVVCDVCMLGRKPADRAKEMIQKHTGIDRGRTLIAATHTHSAPRVMPGLNTNPLNREYEEFFVHRVADAVIRATNNLAPARVGWGVGSKPEFCHNRRALCKPGKESGFNPFEKTPFGPGTDKVWSFTNYTKKNKDLIGPAGPTDPDISFLSVQHLDGRPLALLANYSIHYVGHWGSPDFDKVISDATADYFGYFARSMEQKLGVQDQEPAFVGILSNGTSGDVNLVGGSYKNMRVVANSLTDEVLRVYRQIQYHTWVPLAMLQSEVEIGVRRPEPTRLQWAKELWPKVQEKMEAGKKLSWPEIYAREQIYLNDYPTKVPTILQALRIGELGITAIPNEVFAETGLQIKETSPLEPTFVIGLANAYMGYLPTPKQFELGGYETWPARSSYLEVNASAKIVAELERLLNEVAMVKN